MRPALLEGRVSEASRFAGGKPSMTLCLVRVKRDASLTYFWR